HTDVAVKLQVRGLMAQRVDMRATVLHHRQHPRRSGPRTVLVRPVAVAMPAMEGVEVPRLMRGMHRHAGKARLLEVEDSSAGNLLDERHVVTGSGTRGRGTGGRRGGFG